VAARAWHRRQRWCPRPHYTAHRVDLDPPTRLAEGKPSRKNRPPFRRRKRTTATTLPLPPPLPPPPSAASLERFSRHRATTTSVILSLPPAPPALYTRRLSSYDYRDQPSSRGTWVRRQLYRPRTTSRCFREREEDARAKSRVKRESDFIQR